jgi:hypothetical protein
MENSMTIKTGQHTFNFSLKVPADKVDEVEASIRDHADFMRDTHSCDDSKIHLVHYYVSRSAELNNMTNPDEGTTGNMLYFINEVYMVPEGIGQHMEAAQVWPGFGTFVNVLSDYGTAHVVDGEVIETM